MSWTIRAAATNDRDAIVTVVRDAFSNGGRDGHEELKIVRDTWSLGAQADGLELVAIEDGEVLGHALGAHGDLGGRDVVAVAPLAVTPSRQRRGIGIALMTELVRRANAAGWPLVALLGSPAYYSRFGFEPSSPLGITYPPVGAGNPDFQVRKLSAYDPSFAGDFTYCWEAKPN